MIIVCKIVFVIITNFEEIINLKNHDIEKDTKIECYTSTKTLNLIS